MTIKVLIIINLVCFGCSYVQGQLSSDPNAFSQALSNSNVTNQSLFWTSRNRTSFMNQSRLVSLSNTSWLNSNFSSAQYSQLFTQAHYGLDDQSLGIQMWTSGWNASRISHVSAYYARRLSQSAIIAVGYEFTSLSAKNEESIMQANIRLDGCMSLTEKLSIGCIVDGIIEHLEQSNTPVNIQLGLSYKLSQNANTYLSIYSNDTKIEDLRLGLEYGFNEQFGFNFGMAFKAREFTIGPYLKISESLSALFIVQITQAASIKISLGGLYLFSTNDS